MEGFTMTNTFDYFIPEILTKVSEMSVRFGRVNNILLCIEQFDIDLLL